MDNTHAGFVNVDYIQFTLQEMLSDISFIVNVLMVILTIVSGANLMFYRIIMFTLNAFLTISNHQILLHLTFNFYKVNIIYHLRCFYSDPFLYANTKNAFVVIKNEEIILTRLIRKKCLIPLWLGFLSTLISFHKSFGKSDHNKAATCKHLQYHY